MMCIMPPQHNAKIFVRRISTSLLRLGRRMILVRKERLDYIFSLHVTDHTGCLRVCLPSCHARDGRVLHSRLEPIPCHDTYAIGFLPKSWSDVYVCVRVRLEIAMIFEAFSAAWQPCGCLLDTISTISLLFIRLKERGQRDANVKRKYESLSTVQRSKN